MSTTALSPISLAPKSILGRMQELVLPLGAISVVFVMLIPLPAAALDFLLVLSMAASIVVFLSAVQIRRAVELSVFPTLLLLLTLFRLSLNIASSRRILLHGSEGICRAECSSARPDSEGRQLYAKLEPGDGAVAGGGLSAGQCGDPAYASFIAGHESKQRDHESERRQVYIEPDLGNSQRG